MMQFKSEMGSNGRSCKSIYTVMQALNQVGKYLVLPTEIQFLAEFAVHVQVADSVLGGVVAFGVDIWTIQPEDLTLGLKVSNPASSTRPRR